MISILCRNKDHPKLYLWAQPWTKKTDSEQPDVAANLSVVDDKTGLKQTNWWSFIYIY